jgi:hypothetical protein
MTDVRDEDAVAPAQPAQRDASTWTGYTDTAVIEMRPWDGIESLGGIAASAAGRSMDDRWRQLYGVVRYGDYISRNAGDPDRSNWWVTPAAAFGRYIVS